MTTASAEAALDAAIDPAAYAIEIVTKGCGDLVWAPDAGIRLRSRMVQSRMPQKDSNPALEALRAVGDIPGQVIQVNVQTRTISIIDPLGVTPAGRLLFSKVRAALASAGNREQFEPRESKVYKESAEDTIKEWLHWMARAIKSGKAVAYPGCMTPPSVEEVKKLPGKRRKEPYSRISQKPTEYVDVVKPAVK